MMRPENPVLQKFREQHLQLFQKEHCSRREHARQLVHECDVAQLQWRELPYEVKMRVYRSADTASGGRGFVALAGRLQADQVDSTFYQQQAKGLVGETQLLLEDMEKRRGPLLAAVVLETLLDGGLLLCLNDVSSGVQEALALRQQAQRLRHHSNAGSLMESGYLSSVATNQSAEEIVGTVEGPPEVSSLKAVPVGRENDEPDAVPRYTVPPNVSTTKPPLSGPRLLLTYAADGWQQTMTVADALKARGFRLLLLEQQRRWQLSDRYAVIQKWFRQVDYIVPILTAEYLAATQNRATPPTEHGRRLAEDIRFIYSLMCAEMESNGHVNWRVRCLEPDDAGDEVHAHPIYGSPLFRWPFLLSELDELAECLAEE